MVPVSIKEVHPFSTNKWLEGNPRYGHKRHQLWSCLPENLTVARVENFLPFLSENQQEAGVFVSSAIKGDMILSCLSFIITF